jgi:hypothetical protein
MPRQRTKNRFKADQLVVCWQTAGVDDAIVPGGVIRKGTRLRGGHPWVKEFPQFFVAADTPDDEWPSPFEGLARGAPYEPAAPILEPLPPEELGQARHPCPALPRRCGSTEDLTGDHVVPLSEGGMNVPSNIGVLCRSCNSRRGARPFAQPRPRFSRSILR